MQNKPSTANGKETGQKGGEKKRAYNGGKKKSLKIKKSYHYYKGLLPRTAIFSPSHLLEVNKII